MSKYWYKNAIIYSLDVETFKDSNNDGIGDFKGLQNALTYLSGLGITCLWLLPFFASPNKDNGYDVEDYFSIDPRLGNLGDFAELLDAAEEIGIRILMDLPVNHTSTEHNWFKQARKDKDSKYRDFYIWMEDKPKDTKKNIMAVEGEDGSNWVFDEEANSHYYHTFFPHQPDLNISNPAVQQEIFKIMHFWLKLGVSGFRIDAAPYMFDERGKEEFEEDPHQVFRHFREFVNYQKPDAILLAEVDLEPEQYQKFFGDEDQMHMLFNFYVNNYIYHAFAKEDATSLAKALKIMPNTGGMEQMAVFLRNHDELNLGKLSDKEQEEVFQAFAPQEDMKIFGRGIRRRLAPILKNDRKLLELAHSLLLTLPGTPVIWYGQEIGMGEDLSMEGRTSVRTLMQWSNDKNGGFSDAPQNKLISNIVSEGEFRFEKVNVNDQNRDPDSLLNWMRRAISYRKEFKEFGWGKYTVLDVENNKVLAHCRKSKKGVGIALHNFSNKEQIVTLKFEEPEEIRDIFGDKRYDAFKPENQQITLNPYGYRWLHKKKFFL